jgi:Ni,Fe-hydrogenase maturation factor
MYIDKQLSRALKSDRTMKAVVGFSISEFKDLSIIFDAILQKSKSGKKKIKKEEIEMESFLKTSELKLFFLLFYIKNHPTRELISLLMELNVKKIDLWAQSLHPLFKIALNESSFMPKKKYSQ